MTEPAEAARPKRPHPRDQITTELIAEFLEASGKTFEDGELAYLALTSNIENPIRDRFAFQLRRKLKTLHVGREWTGMRSYASKQRKVDVAIVDSRNWHEGLIEFKAFRAHNVSTPEKAKAALKEVEKDILKSLPSSGFTVKTFAIVLLCHGHILKPREAEKRQGIIKDYFDIAVYNLTGAQPIREQAQSEVSRCLEHLGPVRIGSLDSSTDLGTMVTVDYIIAGPIPVDTFEALLAPDVL